MQASRIHRKTLGKRIREHAVVYLFLLPAVIYIAVFCYAPMYGIQIAFRNYRIADGITGSAWAGLKWFNRFFGSKMFTTILSNTLLVSVYSLVAGFPMPIILALMLNYTGMKFKRIMQTVTYLPHFISTVVMVGLLSCFLSPKSGFVNAIIKAITGDTIYFLGEAKYFRHVYVWSGIWQGIGWGSIIFVAALTSVSPELHESAIIDGANIPQRILHIDLPSIMPTMVIMLILRCGSIMSVGFEKVYLMQNDLNKAASEVISTYTYKQGLLDQNFSYSAAIGLFNNVVNFVLLTLVNKIANRLSGTSLW